MTWPVLYNGSSFKYDLGIKPIISLKKLIISPPVFDILLNIPYYLLFILTLFISYNKLD